MFRNIVISYSEKILPVGLWGELMIIALVLGVRDLAKWLKSISQTSSAVLRNGSDLLSMSSLVGCITNKSTFFLGMSETPTAVAPVDTIAYL
jgi:hypothetical protein